MGKLGKKTMKQKLKPIGKWVLVSAELGKQKITESGIIYTKTITGRMLWGEVVDIGPDLTEDIKIGDKVLWDMTKQYRGRDYDDKLLVHQDWIAMVER